MIDYDTIQDEINKLYEECFVFVEDLFKEEFNCTSDELRGTSRKHPLPYLRIIYTNYLHQKGFPYDKIALRLNRKHSGLVINNNKYKDYYKYISQFRELADRFNNKLKEKKDGI